MFKQFILALAILFSVMGFISCSKDEPNNGSKDPIENPSDDPKDDPSDDPTDDPTQDPTDDGTVTVSADGTASNGMQFRRINETEFMLNYVRYGIYDGHLEVNGHDEIEVLTSLKGKVTIVPAVILDGTKYYTREVGGFTGSKLKEIELPNTVTRIGYCAFSGSSLEAIRIPEKVTKIDDGAFGACTSLSSVELNEGLETLGPSAFSGCSKLEKISIPENVSIYVNTFKSVPLKELRLPGNFNIEGGSFQSTNIVFNSKEIKDIYVNSKIPIKPEGNYYILFEDIILYEAYLHVPEGSSDLYKESPFWGKFINIVEYNPE